MGHISTHSSTPKICRKNLFLCNRISSSLYRLRRKAKNAAAKFEKRWQVCVSKCPVSVFVCNSLITTSSGEPMYVYRTIVTHSRLYFFFLKRFCHRLGMNLSNHGPISSLNDKFCKKTIFPCIWALCACVRARFWFFRKLIFCVRQMSPAVNYVCALTSIILPFPPSRSPTHSPPPPHLFFSFFYNS